MKRSRHLASLVFLFGFALGLHWLAIRSAQSELSQESHRAILIFIGCILLLQSGILLALGLKAHERIWKAVFSFFLTLNFLSLFALHDSSFSGWAISLKLLYIIIIFGIFLSLTYQFFKARLIQILALSVGILGLSLPWLDGLSQAVFGKSEIGITKVKSDNFQKTRNLYFISFDSLIPSSLVKKFIGDVDVPYESVLENEAHIFQNGFTMFSPTKPALNSILALDPVAFEALPKDQAYSFFSGQSESHLGNFLQEKGYKLQTYFDSAYMGATKGPYIDEYINSSTDNTTCNQIYSEWILFGYCHPYVKKHFRNEHDLTPNIPAQNLAKTLLADIPKISTSPAPVFVMAHINAPGHTAPNYKFEHPSRKFSHPEYLERLTFFDYFKLKSQLAAELLNDILNTLKAHDPNAVVMIYGDHGPHTSRRIGLDKKTKLPKATELIDDFVQDRYGTTIALWPKEACLEETKKIREAPYVVNLQLARILAECVTGQDPLNQDYKFQPVIEGQDLSDRVNYMDFIYE